MKFVIRVLDAADGLLAWASVLGECQPGGRVMPLTPAVQMRIERDGRAASVTVHWTDLDVARREDFLGDVDLIAGQIGTFQWIRPLWVVTGERDVPLPPVTVREAVIIGVPGGAFGVSPS